MPHRVVRDSITACGKFFFQAVQRQMRRLVDPLHDEALGSAQKTLPVAAGRTRRHIPIRPIALRPLTADETAMPRRGVTERQLSPTSRRSWQARLDPERLVYRRDLDQDQHGSAAGLETMRKTPPWLCHTRPLAYADLHGALQLDRVAAPCIFDGPDQRPELPRLCRAAARAGAPAWRHHWLPQSAAILRTIRSAGARLWYLAPYAPDLNPIEQAFAKIKYWIRSGQKRTIDDTWRHLGHLSSTACSRSSLLRSTHRATILVDTP